MTQKVRFLIRKTILAERRKNFNVTVNGPTSNEECVTDPCVERVIHSAQKFEKNISHYEALGACLPTRRVNARVQHAACTRHVLVHYNFC